jgi:long-chain acyl-CoA synthetase
VISHPATLSDLPGYAARRYAARVALRTATGDLTFEEVEGRVAEIASGLAQLGIQTGDRIILHLPNNWRWAVAYYAIARLGAVVVPANILLATEEVQFIAEDCGAAAIFAPQSTIKVLRRLKMPDGMHYIAVEGELNASDETSWNDLASTPSDQSWARPAAGDLATIGYTSGTTGRPKGAMLTHACILTNTAMTATMHIRTSSDVVVTALPCSHVYGNVVMNGAFLCGYTLVLLERFEAESVLGAIERYRATLFEGVPTMYYYILGSASLSAHDLSSLTRASVGGQTMPLPQMREVRRRLGCPLLELWGMTEIAGLGTTHSLYGPEKLGSIGQALPLSECRIADMHDRQRDIPTNEPGELLFRGPTVMRGYFNLPDATREALLPGGWLRTGDIAYRDADGFIYVVDRVKEMIITGGYNIYPSEVERVIADHPAVQIVAVGGNPDEAKGELAHAYVVLRPATNVDAETLIAYCRSRLAAYKVPKAIHFVPDLPKTSTGKIIRRALRTLNA